MQMIAQNILIWQTLPHWGNSYNTKVAGFGKFYPAKFPCVQYYYYLILHIQDLGYLQETHEPQQADNERNLHCVTELTHLFSSPSITNDEIIDWIEVSNGYQSHLSSIQMLLYSFLQNHYSPPVVSTPDFITAMTTALVNACMPGILLFLIWLHVTQLYHSLLQDIHIIIYDHVPRFAILSVVAQVYIPYFF